MTIYLIKGSDHTYDNSDWVMGYVKSEEEAKRCVDHLNSSKREYSQYMSDVEHRVYMYAHHLSMTGREELADVFINRLLDKLYAKYPHLTTDEFEESYVYYMEEVEAYAM